MRYRQLDAGGDYTIGKPFLANSPQAVAQAVATRLQLNQGEWFVDTTDGMPWQSQVLGHRFAGRNPDAAVKARILGTTGVKQITSYTSTFDGTSRSMSISVTLDTIYGAINFTQTL